MLLLLLLMPYEEKLKFMVENSKKSYKEIFDIRINKNKSFYTFMKNSSFIIQDFFIENSIRTSVNDLFKKEYDSKLHNSLVIIFKLILCQKLAFRTKNNEVIAIINNSDQLMKIIKSQNNNDKYWYRGQSNFEWNLFPSFYRNLPYDRAFTIKEIEEDYENFGLYSKYKKVLKNKSKYDFLSFMQHSVSFSPFLDFSSNMIVAIVMALCDTKDFRNHYNKDSAVYMLKVQNEINNIEEIDDIIEEINIYYFKSFPFMKKILKDNKELVIDDFDSLIKAMEPNCYFIDIPTNDRMRYQSGRFVLFDNCIIVNNKIYAELVTDIDITKILISKDLKGNRDNILHNINNKYPEYSINYMLNPYEWFQQ